MARTRIVSAAALFGSLTLALACAAAPLAAAAETGDYPALWRAAAEAAVGFAVVELHRQPAQSLAQSAGACQQEWTRLDHAVVGLIAADPPDDWIALHWKILPLFEELDTAAAVICEGEAKGDADEVASGWAWMRSVQNMIATTLANLPATVRP